MSRSSEQVGSTVGRAVAAAIADLLGQDEDQVTVEISAPGLDALPAPARVRLVVDEPADGSVADAETVAASTSPPADEQRVEVSEPPHVDGSGEPAADGRTERLSDADLDAEADAAADFLEGLLDALDLPGDLRINVRDDHAEIELVDIGSGALIGRRGQTLEAIQELVRCSLQREFQRRSHVMVDAEGYRARRLEKLLEKADEAIDTVLDSGEPERLEPMDVFERKAVHHLVAEVEGVESRSQGREPSRRIVIEPA